MKKENFYIIKDNKSPLNLLLSIVLLILGIVIFSNPDKAEMVITYVFGGILLLIGVIKLTWFYFSNKYKTERNKWDLVIGIATIIIGLLCMFFYEYIESAIRIIIGSVILFIGVLRVINAFKNIKTKMFFPLLGLALILMAGGIFIISYQDLVIKGFGLIFIIYSALEIIGFILSQFIPREELNVIKEAQYEVVEK